MFKVKPEWGMWGTVSGGVERKRAVWGGQGLAHKALGVFSSCYITNQFGNL